VTAARAALGTQAVRRPLLTLAVYASAASLLSLHAVVSIAALPYTLAFDRDRRLSARLGSWLTRAALRLRPQWRSAAQGLASIRAAPPARPVVIVMNHRSIADIAIAVGVPGGAKIVSKRWAGRVPLLGLCMRLCGHLIFDPASPRSVRDLMARAEGLLARGNSVLFFPEGTRRDAAGVGAFHEGAFRLAVKMNVDVLPVVLHGMGDLVPKGSITFHDAPVDVTPLLRVGPGGDRRELARRVHAAMAAALEAHARTAMRRARRAATVATGDRSLAPGRVVGTRVWRG
jgi:1-acyl-sn-glycerol-3-phosphate acyltransferase